MSEEPPMPSRNFTEQARQQMLKMEPVVGVSIHRLNTPSKAQNFLIKSGLRTVDQVAALIDLLQVVAPQLRPDESGQVTSALDAYSSRWPVERTEDIAARFRDIEEFRGLNLSPQVRIEMVKKGITTKTKIDSLAQLGFDELGLSDQTFHELSGLQK